MARPPLIGISAMVESATWTVWRGVEANLCQRTYSEGIDGAGGVPVLLPPNDAATEDAEAVVDHLDGLLLSGGADLDPATYGAEPEPETTNYRPERDRFEVALARAARERDLPVLGVCRGMQLLNVACGGTLQQQVDDADLHLHTPGEFADHDVRLEPGSLAAAVVGADRVAVRSHHHQGVAALGEGVRASGWSEPDGLIEAIELPERRWALGILWHAEEDGESPVIAGLIDAARRVAA